MAQSFTRSSPTARQARSVDKALTLYRATFLFLGLPCPEEADGGKPCHCCRRWTNSWGSGVDASQCKTLTTPAPKKKLKVIYHCQLLGLGITLLVSIILGSATGLFISMKKLFETIPDDQLFDDEVSCKVMGPVPGQWACCYVFDYSSHLKGQRSDFLSSTLSLYRV